METKIYNKFDIDEKISVGDLISLVKNTDKVRRSHNRRRTDDIVIGVCIDIDNDSIVVLERGVVDVNVEGLICLGDKLSASYTPGKAIAIKYNQEEEIFDTRSIGKVIGLYKEYSKAKILLDIE